MAFSLLLQLFFITLLTLTPTFCNVTHAYKQCLERQKTLLLDLKNELVFGSFYSTKLVQWNQRDDDCCSWEGVECDGAGHVISLHLDHEGISGGLTDSSTLFSLEYLEKLNLAYNFFNSTQIPREIHKLTHLTHLNLSASGFGGGVPMEISQLRRLVSLDISSYQGIEPSYQGIEPLSLMRLLHNLTQLRELDLSGNDLSTLGSEWCHIISSSTPYLTRLSLQFCRLSGPLDHSLSHLHFLSVLQLDANNLSTAVPDLFANFSSLTSLSLAACSLTGYFPEMIFQLPTLQNLDLSENPSLSGTIPQIPRTTSFRAITLAHTNFSGSLPDSINNLKNLSHLDLTECRFSGLIPSRLSNLTELVSVDLSRNFFAGSISAIDFDGLSSLVNIDLSYNSLSGSIPKSIFTPSSLEKLWLQNNQFSGLINEFLIVNVSNLWDLDLSSNQLQGPIPDSFFQLQSLIYLGLFNNFFSDTFQLDKILSLPNLTSLDLSNNNLSSLGAISIRSSSDDFPDLVKQSVLSNLDLSSNHIAGAIPSWIWEIGNGTLENLNLSCNMLVDLQRPDNIPTSLFLQNLDLHSNQLRGELPVSLLQSVNVDCSNNYFDKFIPPSIIKFNMIDLSSLSVLLLANNSLSGSVPAFICNCTGIQILDLSVNNLSGSIPPCLFENSLLEVLILRRNNMSGRIPDRVLLDCSLQTLDLSHNNLVGHVPRSLGNCRSLAVMNVGSNHIDDIFPCMLPSSLKVLVLRSNRFRGEVRCKRSWPNLQIIDIASNNLSGYLNRSSFSRWRGMMQDSDAMSTDDTLGVVLGRGDYFYQDEVALIIKGLDLKLVSISPQFTSIDFSCNNFQGVVPDSIGQLNALHLLNLSHNSLTGTIPESFSNLTQLEALDLSVNQLTGQMPKALAGLTFLQIMNVSHNKLVGKIPVGSQIQTFSPDSFQGNTGLCGLPLNISCTNTPPKLGNDVQSHGNTEIEWEYVFAALGFVVGLGSIVWMLLCCRSFRVIYFEKIEDVFDNIFLRRQRKKRWRQRARRVVRNQVTRQ